MFKKGFGYFLKGIHLIAHYGTLPLDIIAKKLINGK